MNKLSIRRPGDTMATVIPNEFLDKYMPQASGEFVKVYLYFLRYVSCPDSGVSLSTAADTFCTTESDILRALRYWEKEGLLRLSMDQGVLSDIELLNPGAPASAQAAAAPNSPTGFTLAGTGDTHLTQPPLQSAPAPSPAGSPADSSKPLTPNMYNGVPAYTMEDIQNFKIYNDGDQLFFVIQQYLGKPLGPTDINTIVFFSEQLHFPSELIEYLFEYCVSNNHYSIHYIEKTAIAWAREGIDTVAKARSHCTYYNKTSFDILKAFGITNRNPAKSEVDYIQRWTREYGFPLNLILEACRRTIEATHAPSFTYAEKILKNWFDHHVGSMDDVKKLDTEHEKKRQEAAPSDTGAPAYVNSFAKKGAAPPSKTKGRNNKFHNFEQRTYDYGELEQTLLNKARKQADTPTGGK